MGYTGNLSRAVLAAAMFVAGILCLHPAALAAAPAATITLSEIGGVPISPYLYGINYDWNRIPAGEFDSFATAMRQVAHYTLVRYPGGWNAENYDWTNNIETGNKAPALPGVAPGILLSSMLIASFITPSEQAIADPAEIQDTVAQTTRLVAQYGGQVPVWEIGNEWWLQQGAKKNFAKRRQNLQNYAALLAAIVPAIKAENPSVKVFATVDWTTLGDIATLRELTGAAAWSKIDGISVHLYCGNLDRDHLCSLLPERLATLRAVSGKPLIYASEWAVAKTFSTDDFGIRNASDTIGAIQDLAFSGVTYAAYWPPVKVLPALAFVSADYGTPFATGIAFGWMSQYYEGTALHTTGSLPAVAARNGASTTVIIPSENSVTQNVQIDLAGTGLTKVVSAEVMYSPQPEDPKASRLVNIAKLPTTIGTAANGSAYVHFVINPGTPGRGHGFEIARVTLG